MQEVFSLSEPQTICLLAVRLVLFAIFDPFGPGTNDKTYPTAGLDAAVVSRTINSNSI